MAILEITSELRISFLGTTLQWTHPIEFYRAKQFLFKCVGDNLHILVNFPVSFIDETTRIHQIQTYRLAVPNNTMTTVLSSPAKYFLTLSRRYKSARARYDPLMKTETFSYHATLDKMPNFNDDGLLNVLETEKALLPATYHSCIFAISIKNGTAL